MTELEEISKIREQIFSSNLDGALSSLSSLVVSCNDSDLRNRIILGCSRINKALNNQVSGLADKPEDYNRGVYAILDYLDELDKYFQDIDANSFLTVEELNLNSTTIQQVYSKLKDITSRVHELDDDQREKIYEQRLRLSSLIHKEIDEKIAPYYGNLIFNRLFFAKELTQIEKNEINSLASNNSFLWYQKSIIISGVSLSLIKEFDVDKVEILLNYLNQFEDQVWQKALLGLVLGLHNRDHLISLYPQIIRRLNNLKEINEVEKGLAQIEVDLRNKEYKGCFEWAFLMFINRTKGYKVLVKPEYWFLPFYEGNPILEEFPKSLPNLEGVSDLPELLLKDKHLSNSQKYVICLNIKDWSENQVKYLISELEKSKDCEKDHIYDRYLSDFYWFYDLFEEENFDKEFAEKIRIYDTALIDLIISDKGKDVYDILVEFHTGNKAYALDKFSRLSSLIDQTSLYKKEFGYFYFLLSEYEKSLELFKFLSDEAPENSLFQANLSFLYLVLGDTGKSYFHTQKALELGDEFFSNKNFGYHALLSNEMEKAVRFFRKSAKIGGTGRLIREINSDVQHLRDFFDQGVITEVKKKLKSIN